MAPMPTIAGVLGKITASVTGPVGAWTARPAHQLSTFMDGLDDVWLLDAFLDQPELPDLGS